MHPPLRPRIFASVSLILMLLAAPASAGEIASSVWMGAGGSWPEYHNTGVACLRGGVDAVFWKRLTLGVSAQADRLHTHLFVDAGLILPQIGTLQPYGKFQFGRRDDRDDDAMGWVGGFYIGEDEIRLFVEANGIMEPEDNKGVTAGISF